MQILGLLISDKAEIDQGTSKLDILGVFNTINSYNFPAKHAEFIVTVITEGDPCDRNYSVDIELAGKKIVGLKENISSGERNYLFARFANVIFPMAGKYTVRVEVNGIKAETNLYLKLASHT